MGLNGTLYLPSLGGLHTSGTYSGTGDVVLFILNYPDKVHSDQHLWCCIGSSGDLLPHVKKRCSSA